MNVVRMSSISRRGHSVDDVFGVYSRVALKGIMVEFDENLAQVSEIFTVDGPQEMVFDAFDIEFKEVSRVRAEVVKQRGDGNSSNFTLR